MSTQVEVGGMVGGDLPSIGDICLRTVVFCVILLCVDVAMILLPKAWANPVAQAVSVAALLAGSSGWCLVSIEPCRAAWCFVLMIGLGAIATDMYLDNVFIFWLFGQAVELTFALGEWSRF